MKQPLVSILIPCHNAGAWIAETLDSVLAQSWTNTEVIVVNDASSDNSPEILANYTPRLAKVINTQLGSAAKARNCAFGASSGDLIKFLDADDLLSPDAVSRQVDSLHGFPRHIAQCEWGRFENSPTEAEFTPASCWRDATAVDWLVSAWTGGQPMQQCGMFLIPRELIIDAGTWDERLSLIDDFEFFARLVAASEGIRFSAGARLYYRSRIATSLSQRSTRTAWESAFLAATLGIDQLLNLEDSLRTRRASADCLMETAGAMYPFVPDLVQRLESRIADLGGTDIVPRGGRIFRMTRGVLGWKSARRLQVLLRGQ